MGTGCWVLTATTFSLFVVAGAYCHVSLYEKVASKATSAEPLPRWAIGTGQSSCLQFRSGTIARRGRGGIMPFGSASTTRCSLCPPGHGCYMKHHGIKRDDPVLRSYYFLGYHQKSLSSRVSTVKIRLPDLIWDERRVSSRPHRIKRSQDMIQPRKNPCFLNARAA